MDRRDVLQYDDRFLAVRLSQARENRVGGFLCLIELADLRIRGYPVGIEPVLIEEARPYAVLVRVGNAECVLGAAP